MTGLFTRPVGRTGLRKPGPKATVEGRGAETTPTPDNRSCGADRSCDFHYMRPRSRRPRAEAARGFVASAAGSRYRDEIDDEERGVVARHDTVVEALEEPVGELLTRALPELLRALGEPRQPGVEQLGLSLN